MRTLAASSLLAISAMTQGLIAQSGTPLEEILRSPLTAIPDGAPPAMANIDRVELARHAYFLASDALGGRHTGTASQRAAAEYVAANFRRAGLAPLGDANADGSGKSYVQEYSVARTYLDRDKTFLELAGERVEEGFAVARGEADAADVRGELIYCGLGKRREMPETIQEGQVPVIFLDGPKKSGAMAPEMQFMMGFREMARVGGIAKNLQRRGAKTVLILDWQNRLGDIMQYAGVLPGKPDLQYGNEMGMSGMMARSKPPIPVILAGRPLAEKIVAGLKMTIGEDDRPTQPEEGTAPPAMPAHAAVQVARSGAFPCSNVVAYLEGSDPKLKHEAIVFSAHMDHMGKRMDGEVFNGADDNASGSSALLEIAQAFAIGKAPRRSVIFLSVSGEELGLWGSDHFANNPTWPVENIVANINIDMIGRATDLSDENQISITPSYRHPKFSSIARDSAEIAKAFGMTFTNGDTYYERSDHYNFAQKGIPVVFYCDGEHPDYHQVSDTADKLDYTKMETVARLAYWTGWTVAESDERPVELGRRAGWNGEEKGE